MDKNRGAAIAFVALMLVPVAGAFVAPNQPISKATTEHKRANQDQNDSKSEPPSFAAIRLIFGNGEIAKYCDTAPDNEKEKWSHKYICDVRISDFFVAVFTGLLFIATAGLIVVGLRQFWDSRVLQRAYLSVSPAGIEPFRSLDGRLSCDLYFENSGNLPAQDVSWFIDQKFSTDSNLSEFPIDENKFVGNNLIPPHGRIRKGGPAINSAELDAFRGLQQGKPDSCWLYVWGRVRYVDGFNNRRWIDFCYRYYLAGTSWTIGPEHGRQHEYGNRTDEG